MNGSTPGIPPNILQQVAGMVVGAIIPNAPPEVREAAGNEVAHLAGMAITRIVHAHRVYGGVNSDRDASGLTPGERAAGDTAASVLGDNITAEGTNATAPDQGATATPAPTQQTPPPAPAAPTAATGSSDQTASTVVGSIPRATDESADARAAADAVIARARAGGATREQPATDGGSTVPVGAAPERAAGTPETPLPAIAADRTVPGGYTPPDTTRETGSDAFNNQAQNAAQVAGRTQVNTGGQPDITPTLRNALDDAAAGGAIVEQPPTEGGALDTAQLAADAGGTIVEQPAHEGGALREPVGEPGTTPAPAPAAAPAPTDDRAAFQQYVDRLRSEYPAIAAQIDAEIAAANSSQGASSAPQL